MKIERREVEVPKPPCKYVMVMTEDELLQLKYIANRHNTVAETVAGLPCCFGCPKEGEMRKFLLDVWCNIVKIGS